MSFRYGRQSRARSGTERSGVERSKRPDEQYPQAIALASSRRAAYSAPAGPPSRARLRSACAALIVQCPRGPALVVRVFLPKAHGRTAVGVGPLPTSTDVYLRGAYHYRFPTSQDPPSTDPAVNRHGRPARTRRIAPLLPAFGYRAFVRDYKARRLDARGRRSRREGPPTTVAPGNQAPQPPRVRPRSYLRWLRPHRSLAGRRLPARPGRRRDPDGGPAVHAVHRRPGAAQTPTSTSDPALGRLHLAGFRVPDRRRPAPT